MLTMAIRAHYGYAMAMLWLYCGYAIATLWPYVRTMAIGRTLLHSVYSRLARTLRKGEEGRDLVDLHERLLPEKVRCRARATT